MGKCIINEYLVANSKFSSQNKQIAFISDIHSDVNKFKMIFEKLKALKVHALLIGGDLIDDNKYVKCNLIIKELLYELAKTMKIFIVIGNHDMIYFGGNTSNYRCETKSSNLDFFENLTGDNIYVSDMPYNGATLNKWYLDDEIDISSLNLPIEYYCNKEDTKEFLTLLDEVEKPDIDSNKYNILLCHPPKNIFNTWPDNSYLSQFDLILTGHMHSGMMPYFLRKQTYGRGLVDPYKTLLPEYAYGYLNNNNNCALLISGGVTKIPNSLDLGNHKIFDTIYPSELEIFNFQYDPNNNSFEKVKTKKI